MTERYCQSCGRLIHEVADCGRETDGSINENYCDRCYREGKFTEPELTRWQMIARIIPLWMEEKQVPYRQALIDANYFLSGLRRWQTRRMWT